MMMKANQIEEALQRLECPAEKYATVYTNCGVVLRVYANGRVVQEQRESRGFQIEESPDEMMAGSWVADGYHNAERSADVSMVARLLSKDELAAAIKEAAVKDETAVEEYDAKRRGLTMKLAAARKDEGEKVVLINMTPHPVIIDDGKTRTIINPEPTPFRVPTKRQIAPSGLPYSVDYIEFDSAELPAKIYGTYYIVSVVAGLANPDRRDFVVPDTERALRDESGRIIAVPGFVSYATPRQWAGGMDHSL